MADKIYTNKELCEHLIWLHRTLIKQIGALTKEEVDKSWAIIHILEETN